MISLPDAPIAVVGLQFLNCELTHFTHEVIQSDYRKTLRLKRQSLT